MSGPFCEDRVLGSTAACKNGNCTPHETVGASSQGLLQNQDFGADRRILRLGTEDSIFTCRTISRAVFACDDVFLHDVFLLFWDLLIIPQIG